MGALGPPPAGLVGILAEQAKLTGIGDARGDRNDRFGSTVAADDETVVVGAPGHDLTGQDRGAAYVFAHAAGVWAMEAKLSPSGPATGFGASVDVSGDTVVVGSSDFGASAVYVFVRTGGVWNEEASITGSDTEAGDRFGAAVSVSGNTIVVGSPNDTTGFGVRSGSAHVFVRSGGAWSEQQKLLPTDLAADDSFGQSVSVSGDSLIAGSPTDDTGGGLDAGSAYVFVRSGTVWAQASKLTAPGGGAGDLFGFAVSMDIDAAAVGAPWEDAAPSVVGAAYVFRRESGSWGPEQRLVATPPLFSQEFGAAVALDADSLIVGAPREDTGAFGAGAGYAFVRGGGVWSQEQRITPSVPGLFAEFGRSVALAGDGALVGEPGRDDGSGAALVFRRGGSTWAEEIRLVASGTASFDAVGSAVALSGDVLAVGAPRDEIAGVREAGAVYIFERTGSSWALQQKIVPSDASEGGRFGAAVALLGSYLLVGAPGHSAAGFGSGAAYVFVRRGGSWELSQRFVAPNGGSFDGFGSAVSFDGFNADSLIVGAPGEEEGAAVDAGAAYVFAYEDVSYRLEQRLVSSTPVNFAAAGLAVAIEADTAFVGVPRDPGNRKVLAFRRTTGSWSEEQALSASDGITGDGFGQAIALSGDTLIVGSPQAVSQGISHAGAAYVFTRSGGVWVQEQKLVAAEPRVFGELGTAVAVSGDLALAGSGAQASSSDGGFALLFDRTGTTWTERQRIVAFDGAPDDRFGAAVALSSDTAVVGAPGAGTPAGFESGAAYVLVPANADLSLGITGTPGSIVQGDPVTYTIVVSNSGPTAAPAVGVVNAVDPGLVIESASASQGGCRHTASNTTCDIGVVPAGATATLTVLAVGVGVGTQTSQASILWDGSDPVPGNETGSVTTTVGAGGPADISVTKTSLSVTAAVGSTLVYRINVLNQGPATAAGVAVYDPTPPGLTLVGTAGCADGFPCTFPRIPAGQTRTIFATFDIPASYPGPNPVVNSATVTTTTPDPVASNDTSTVQTPFFVPAGSLDYYTVTPCRLVDTRNAAQGGPNPLAAGSVQVFIPGFGPCGVPLSARAIAVNVTVTQPSALGNVRVYPAGIPVPLVSTINYRAQQTRGSNAIVSLGQSNGLAVYVGQSSGAVHVIIDVAGYFE